MLNKKIPKEQLKKLKLFMMDSDGVSVKKGTKVIEHEVEGGLNVDITANKITDQLAEKINELKKKMMFCVASGRGMLWLFSMYSKIVDSETMFMAENGNLVFMNGKLHQLIKYDSKHFELLAKIKNEVKKLPIRGFEPKLFNLSVNCGNEIPAVPEAVKKLDTENKLKCMWVGDEVYDIQKREMSKGLGVKMLKKRLGLKKEEIIAIGDGYNDKEMLEEAGIAVSADMKRVQAPYYIESEEGLAGEVLVDYLLKNL